MSRVDPSTIAVYSHEGLIQRAALAPEVQTNIANGCPLVRGPGDYRDGAIDLDCFRFPEDWPGVGNTASHLRRVEATRSELLRPWLAYARATADPVARNRLVQILLKHSDDVCTLEMGRITSNEATVNASLNILNTAATTTANIVTGDQAERILTGIGTFAGASRSHINADVYRNTVAYAISRAITLERQRLRELIEARYGQGVRNFTVDEGVRAVNQYHGVCSFYKGLELVLASVEGDQRSRARQARRAQIDELEEQIRREGERMRALGNLSADERKPFLDRINVLEDRIQALMLAGVPASDVPEEQDQADPPRTDENTEAPANVTAEPGGAAG